MSLTVPLSIRKAYVAVLWYEFVGKAVRGRISQGRKGLGEDIPITPGSNSDLAAAHHMHHIASALEQSHGGNLINYFRDQAVVDS
jgi:hypothetical protein